MKSSDASGPRAKSRRADSRRAAASDRLLVRNLQKRVKVDIRRLGDFFRRVAAEAGADEGASATLVLVGDKRMQALNDVFRGQGLPTDVLAFSAGDMVSPEDQDYLGDIVISVDSAQCQARDRGFDLESELRILLLHGFLHLLGHDHETDGGEMRRLEYRLRRKLGITRPRAKRPPSRLQES